MENARFRKEQELLAQEAAAEKQRRRDGFLKEQERIQKVRLCHMRSTRARSACESLKAGGWELDSSFWSYVVSACTAGLLAQRA